MAISRQLWANAPNLGNFLCRKWCPRGRWEPRHWRDIWQGKGPTYRLLYWPDYRSRDRRYLYGRALCKAEGQTRLARAPDKLNMLALQAAHQVTYYH